MNGSTTSPASSGGQGLEIVAFLLSLVAVIGVGYYAFARPDPLGKGMDAYDFSSAEGTLRSEMEMRLYADQKAELELDRKTRDDKEMQEALDTLEVKKEATWNDKTVVFFTFKQNDKPIYRAEWLEQIEGQWIPSRVRMSEVEKDDKKLAATILSWRRDGSLEPKPHPDPDFGKFQPPKPRPDPKPEDIPPPPPPEE